jgi:hypothetical protein
MAWHSIGKVTVAVSGTPVQVPNAGRIPCQTIFFQQVSTNTGKIYICDRSNAVFSTGVGVLATIPAPTFINGVATVLPYAAVTVPSAPAALDAAQIWIDVDVGGESCQVSVVRA